MHVQRLEQAYRPSPAARRLAGTRLWNSPSLGADEQRALEDIASSPRSVRANTDIIREGAPADSLFVVLDGWAFRYATTREGGRQIPALLLPGDTCNLDSLMLDRLDYGVRTITDATVVSLPRDRAVALAAQHPGIARTFTCAAIVENAVLSAWMLSLARRPSKERLAHLLCELNARLGVEHDNRSHFAFPMTQEQLADALGLTPVHVNRTMQQLRYDGLVESERRTLVLPDVAALRRVAGFNPRYLHADSPPYARCA